ncbi:MAG TPA: ThiF family adenylyltransferase [Syntrophomonas sp.]|nr:ThiF family adenylyltransferase [Syntrophomonas sp.]HRW11833.1 ThiF family adenylyltransferase [Syntrophomonas sp.]
MHHGQGEPVPERYLRNLQAISASEQAQLRDARVGVCGCGGLGLYVVNYLARLGVGRITVWDPDVFHESNINRQLLASYKTLGQKKAEVCRQYVQEINPEVVLTALPCLWEAGDPVIFAQQQVIVDALDSIPSRLALAEACGRAALPMVHGAVGGWYGQVTVIMPGDKTLHALYSNTDRTGIEEEQGTLSFTAAVIAGMQAAEVIKLLLKRESDLIHEIGMVDLLDLGVERFQKNATPM